jgi:hypothetical protein
VVFKEEFGEELKRRYRGVFEELVTDNCTKYVFLATESPNGEEDDV